MSKKRFIDTSFWSDVWVIDKLTRDERYFFMYLLTNDKTSVAGVYEISVKMMAFEADFTRDQIFDMFRTMSAKVHYVDGWVVMRNGISNQNYRNEKIRRGIEIVLESCPQGCLKYIDFPKDFKTTLVKPSVIHDSSMTLEDSLHSDSELDSDLESDSELDAGSAAAPQTGRAAGLNKKTYAAAVRADEQLAKKEAKARTRKPDGDIEDVSDVVRKRLKAKGLKV